MSLAHVRKPTSIVLSLLLALAALSFAPQPAAPAPGDNAIALRAPSFVRVASAQDAPAAAPMGFPQDEAGISAYFKSASPVTLADVRSVYRVIEAETADYIIGSVPVPDYPESQDVHAYVHRDGWFLVYYPSSDVAARIMDWRRYVDGKISTRFESVLAVLAGAAGVALPGATYYDFRFPNATHLMFIAESVPLAGNTGSDSFEIKIPSNYLYYERGWSLVSDTGCGGGYGSLSVDGVRIQQNGCGNWVMTQGAIPPAQLLPDTSHTVVIVTDSWYRGGFGANGGLVLVYRVP